MRKFKLKYNSGRGRPAIVGLADLLAHMAALGLTGTDWRRVRRRRDLPGGGWVEPILA